jgi:hypothetical protein
MFGSTFSKVISSDKNKKIKVPINLIIHDEYYTIVNEITRRF